MKRKYSDSFSLLLFSLFVFIILPSVKAGFTIDPDLAPKFFLTCVFLVLFSGYLFFSKLKLIELDDFSGKVFSCIILILVWMLLSVIGSLNKGDAFLEVARIATLYSFFFVSFLIFKNSQNPLKVVCLASAVAVFIFSFIGLIQLYKPLNDYLGGPPYFIVASLSSSLANKNFFSEVLVLFIPLLLIGFFNEKKLWRLIIGIALLLDVSYIILLQTVAAWLAIFVSVCFFAILSVSKKINLFNFIVSKKIKTLLLSFIVFLFFIGYLVYKDTSNYKGLILKIKRTSEYITNPSFLSETREENNNSVFERLVIWRNSLKMIIDYPVMGAGLNNWKLFNPSYGIGGTPFTNSGFVNYEHPHNDYLLIWAEQGPAGIILYVLFFILIIRFGIRKINSSDAQTKRSLAFLLSGIVAFMTLSFFGYPRSRFYSMIVLLILSSLILTSNQDSKCKVLSIKPAAFLIIMISIFGLTASWFRIKGEINTKSMMVSQLNSNYARMLRDADKAHSWFYPMELTSTPIDWYKGLALFYSGRKEEAVAEYEKALLINPNHLRLLNDLATTYEQTNQSEKAITLYRKAIQIIPLFIEANVNLSAAYYNAGNIDSSFYFIDRIYSRTNKKDGMGNYYKFLDPILYAKALDVINDYNNPQITEKLKPLIEDQKSLNSIYIESKEQNQPFAKYLINYSKVK